MRVKVGIWIICTRIQLKLKPYLSVFAVIVPFSVRFVVTFIVKKINSDVGRYLQRNG